jgi:autotransporter passenger strand-loop-strand repeat protein
MGYYYWVAHSGGSFEDKSNWYYASGSGVVSPASAPPGPGDSAVIQNNIPSYPITMDGAAVLDLTVNTDQLLTGNFAVTDLLFGAVIEAGTVTAGSIEDVTVSGGSVSAGTVESITVDGGSVSADQVGDGVEIYVYGGSLSVTSISLVDGAFIQDFATVSAGALTVDASVNYFQAAFLMEAPQAQATIAGSARVVDGGIINLAYGGSMSIGGDLAVAGGNLSVGSGGSVTVAGDAFVEGSTASSAANVVDYAVLDFAHDLTISAVDSSFADFTIQPGATVSVGGNAVIAAAGNGEAPVTISGGGSLLQITSGLTISTAESSGANLTASLAVASGATAYVGGNVVVDGDGADLYISAGGGVVVAGSLTIGDESGGSRGAGVYISGDDSILSAASTVINANGAEYVAFSAAVTSTTINDNGFQDLYYGTADSTKVNNGGFQNVDSASTANLAVVNAVDCSSSTTAARRTTPRSRTAALRISRTSAARSTHSSIAAALKTSFLRKRLRQRTDMRRSTARSWSVLTERQSTRPYPAAAPRSSPRAASRAARRSSAESNSSAPAGLPSSPS